jgi:hypothetical protein
MGSIQSHVCACADRNSLASILLRLEVYSMAWYPPLIDSAVCRSMNEWIIYTLLRNTGCISLLSRQGGSIEMWPRQQATILLYRSSPTLLYPEIMIGIGVASSEQ